jgi:large subunit ribosomal protein L24
VSNTEKMSSSGRAKMMQMLMRPNKSKRKGYQKQDPPRRWNIVKGDTVQVIDRKHPEYGKQGKVMVVIREKLRVMVENVNLGPKYVPTDPMKGTKAETIMSERSIHYSNVNLVDPVTGFPTKITYSYLEDGTKVRIAKRSGAIIPKPQLWKEPQSSSLSNLIASEDSDTIDPNAVWGVTYEQDKTLSKWEAMRLELVKTLEEKNINQKPGGIDYTK